MQVFCALQQAQTQPLSELATLQLSMGGQLEHLFACLAAAGSPFHLPEGVVLSSVDAAYARQVLQAVAPAVPAGKGDHPLAAAFDQAEQAVAALEAAARPLRRRVCAAVASACIAWQALPERITGLVQPLMAALRHCDEPHLHEQVR
jgi:Domain of unknown function (DUF3535)